MNKITEDLEELGLTPQCNGTVTQQWVAVFLYFMMRKECVCLENAINDAQTQI